jgi:hypothetical protein
VKIDPTNQYYCVQYVADNDLEEYDEFELSKMLLSVQDKPELNQYHDLAKKLPKYGIGTLAGKFFDVDGVARLYVGNVTMYNAASGYYFVQYEDGDSEEVDDNELGDMIQIVLRNFEKKFNNMFHFVGPSNVEKKKDIQDPKQKRTSSQAKAKPKTLVYVKSKKIGRRDVMINCITKVEHRDMCLFANNDMITTNMITDALNKMTLIDPKLRRKVADFFLFIHERQKVFLNRKKLKLSSSFIPPVNNGSSDISDNDDSSSKNNTLLLKSISENRILREYIYCNMYREVDRGSQYLRRKLLNELLDFTNSTETNTTTMEKYVLKCTTRREWTLRVLWITFLYRLVGRTETFDVVNFPKLRFSTEEKSVVSNDKGIDLYNEKVVNTYIKTLKDMMADGITVFTGSYQTPPLHFYANFLKKLIAKNCKMLNNVCDVIMEYYSNDKFTTVSGDAKTDPLYDYHARICKELQGLPGIAIFFGWQIFSDLQEAGCVPVHPSSFVPSLHAVVSSQSLPSRPYVLLGPGATWGLDLIFGRIKSDGINGRCDEQIRRVHYLLNHQSHVYEALGIRFSYWNNQVVSVKVIEYVIM